MSEYRIDRGFTKGVWDVLKERQRQVNVNHFDADHDDKNNPRCELARAAACYALAAAGDGSDETDRTITATWPWKWSWWKPRFDYRRRLVVAAALLIAEIERIDRGSQQAVAPAPHDPDLLRLEDDGAPHYTPV